MLGRGLYLRWARWVPARLEVYGDWGTGRQHLCEQNSAITPHSSHERWASPENLAGCSGLRADCSEYSFFYGQVSSGYANSVDDVRGRLCMESFCCNGCTSFVPSKQMERMRSSGLLGGRSLNRTQRTLKKY